MNHILEGEELTEIKRLRHCLPRFELKWGSDGAYQPMLILSAKALSISTLSSIVGIWQHSDLSNLPGRRSAGSIRSGWLVAAIIFTPTTEKWNAITLVAIGLHKVDKMMLWHNRTIFLSKLPSQYTNFNGKLYNYQKLINANTAKENSSVNMPYWNA